MKRSAYEPFFLKKPLQISNAAYYCHHPAAAPRGYVTQGTAESHLRGRHQPPPNHKDLRGTARNTLVLLGTMPSFVRDPPTRLAHALEHTHTGLTPRSRTLHPTRAIMVETLFKSSRCRIIQSQQPAAIPQHDIILRRRWGLSSTENTGPSFNGSAHEVSSICKYAYHHPGPRNDDAPCQGGASHPNEPTFVSDIST